MKMLMLAACCCFIGHSTADAHVLRVCADPQALPYSNDKGEGFENRIAELVARDLHWELQYVWWPQQRGFIRKTLGKNACDVIMGLPTSSDMVEPTRPYYVSSYVAISRADRNIAITNFDDPALRDLRIGVQLAGDDGVNTPPVHALAASGQVDNVTGFPLNASAGDQSAVDPIVDAIEHGGIDIAFVWGPFAGYAQKRASFPIRITKLVGVENYAPLLFTFAISAGVRKGDAQLKEQLDGALRRQASAIAGVLSAYGVPLIPSPSEVTQ